MERIPPYNVTDVVLGLTTSASVNEEILRRAEELGIVGPGAADRYTSEAVAGYLALLSERGPEGHIYIGSRDKDGTPHIEKELVIPPQGT